MTDFSSLTDEQLNRMDKHVLITIIKGLQLNTITYHLEFNTEQIALMTSILSAVRPNRRIRCTSSYSLKSSAK